MIGGCKGDDGGDRNNPPDAGCWKCKRCKVACPVLKEGNKFESTNTGKTYFIREKVGGAGCWKCKVACPVLKEGNKFESTNTGKTYFIREKVGCDSDWVIYLVTCKRCRGQYIGKSQTIFKKRHSNHKQEIKRKVGGLGHHYGSGGPCDYQHFQVQIIEQVKHKNKEYLAERELHWQHQMRTYIENGGRAHCYRKDF